MNFTYDAYLAFVELRVSQGFEMRAFHDDPPRRDDRVLLLRHDIDLDLDAAVTMATIEHGHSIHATYFVLLTSPFYNPRAADRGAQIREIARLGHWIGLHHDASDAHFGRRGPRLAAELAEIAEAPVRTISYHRPSPDLIGAPRAWWPLRNTYQAEFVREIEYCSDSRGEWAYGPPDDRPLGALHLLTHPEWWGVDDLTPTERMDHLLARRASIERDEFAAIHVGSPEGE